MKLSEAELKLINSAGKIAAQWGLAEPVGRVLGALQLSESGLTQSEIAQKTGYTLSLVSPSLSTLHSLGFVASKRGENRKKVYSSKVTLAQVMSRMFEKFIYNDIKPIVEIMEQLDKKDLEKNPRLKKNISQYKRMERFFKMFQKITNINAR